MWLLHDVGNGARVEKCSGSGSGAGLPAAGSFHQGSTPGAASHCPHRWHSSQLLSSSSDDSSRLSPTAQASALSVCIGLVIKHKNKQRKVYTVRPFSHAVRYGRWEALDGPKKRPSPLSSLSVCRHSAHHIPAV